MHVHNNTITQNNQDSLKVCSWVPISKIHGPGLRFVLWVQGCSLHCEGCANQELWSPEAGYIMSVNQIISEIEKVKRDNNLFEGITITGGEPLEQASAVLALIMALKERSITVVLFTGYELEEIKKDPLKLNIFNLSAIAIIGRFHLKEQNLFSPWRGSLNQKIIFHNQDYELKYSNLPELNEFEIHIDEQGNEILTGFPEASVRKWLL